LAIYLVLCANATQSDKAQINTDGAQGEVKSTYVRSHSSNASRYLNKWQSVLYIQNFSSCHPKFHTTDAPVIWI